MAFGGGNETGPKSDINITPLVDVVLVLLIIFMVAVPALIKEMPVEVPQKSDVVLTTPTSDQILVGISREGSITVNREPVIQAALASRMHELLDERNDKLVFFDIDDGANYGDAMHVMDLCRGAGAKVLGLKTKS